MSSKQPKPQDVPLEVPYPGREKAKLSDMGGSRADEWNSSLANFLARALPTSSEMFSKEDQEREKVAALCGLTDCAPADPLEAMMFAQIISANATALELQRRAWLANQTFEARTRFLGLADRSARTVALLVETLNRHRGKGQQIVRVERVTVNEGGQAVVGAITQHRGGERGKNREQPHGKPLTHAPGAAMLGQVEAHRETVPVASGAGV